MRPARGDSPLRFLLAGNPPAAILLAGDGAGLAGLVAESLVERLRRDGGTAESRVLTAADMDREQAVSEWRLPSFFAKHRVFVLPDLAELKKKARDEIRSYLASPEPSATLVFPCSDRGAARAFSAISGVRTFAPGEEDTVRALAAYAASMARRAGVELGSEQAAFLARWVGADFSRLKEETAKLVGYAGGSGTIGEEQIREICVARGGADPFGLADALLRRDAAQCLSMFRAFARSADGTDYHALLGALAWKVRRASAAGRLPARRAADMLLALSRLDRGLKGESGLSPEQQFELCLIGLLA